MVVKPTVDKVKTIAEIFHKSTVVTERSDIHGMPDGDVRAKAQTGVCYKVEVNILYSKTHSQVKRCHNLHSGCCQCFMRK